MAARKCPPPWKTSGAGSSAAGSQQRRSRKQEGEEEEEGDAAAAAGDGGGGVLRNGAWVGGGTVTIRNDRTYMVRLDGGMTVLATRRRVRPAPVAPPVTDVSPKSDKAAGD